MAKKSRPRPKLVSGHEMWMGRNTKCTPVLIEELCSHLRMALPIVHACALVGISDVTFRNWLNWGETYLTSGENPHHEIYGDFFVAVRRARAEWQLRLLEDLEADKASFKPGWVKAMTVLERRDREHWGRSDQSRGDDLAKTSPDDAFL